MEERIKTRIKKEEGSVAILVAFLLVVLLGCAALALDFGVVYLRKAQLQNAIDIASRASSRILASEDYTEEQKQTKCVEVAKYYLKENGFPEKQLAVCDIEVDPEKGISIVAQSHVNYTFAKIFNQDGTDIAASGSAVTDYTVTEGKRVTVDVALVLDVSGSMYWASGRDDRTQTKLIPMINAVNKTIDSILNENPDNRVSVIVYSSAENVKTLVKLRSQINTVSSIYVRSQNKTFNFQSPTCEIPHTYIGYAIDEHYDRYRDGRVDHYISIAVGGQDDGLYQKTGGTFTQKGIYKGVQTLLTSPNDGIKRVPAVFVLSDGEATYANTNYKAEINGKDLGDGTTGNGGIKGHPDIGYYTILTANYLKDKLSNEYTRRNGQETDAKFYSLGFALNQTAYRDFAAGVLNPDTLNDDANVYSQPAKKLKELLKNHRNPYKNNYNYCDTYYEAVGENELNRVLEDFANDVVLPTKSFNTRLTK